MSAKQTVTIEEVLAALEQAKERVISGEVKSLTKLGIPQAMANKMVARRFRSQDGDSEAESFEGQSSEDWQEE